MSEERSSLMPKEKSSLRIGIKTVDMVHEGVTYKVEIYRTLVIGFVSSGLKNIPVTVDGYGRYNTELRLDEETNVLPAPPGLLRVVAKYKNKDEAKVLIYEYELGMEYEGLSTPDWTEEAKLSLPKIVEVTKY